MTLLILVIVTLLTNIVNCQDAVGCGGFIKADLGALKLSYNKLSIQLTSAADGSLRYVTEVLPNGAYSMPVYDPGEYVLRVEAPEGWTFEPSVGHPISVDGRESCQQDYNFEFGGFSVFGQVVTKRLSTGPSDIEVHLIAGKTEILSTKTVEGGWFTLTGVTPRQYTIQLGNTKMASSIAVAVKVDNVKLTTPITIEGFRAEGQVTSEDQPITGVRFILFSPSVKVKDIDLKKVGCKSVEAIDSPRTPQGQSILCESLSDAEGIFRFYLLPGGDFTVVPFYRGEKIVFDVEPAQLSFKIEHEDVALGSVFRVAGFSVAGRVLSKAKSNQGVVGAQVFINGKLSATTDKEGRYHLDSMKTGKYTIKVEGVNMEFPSIDVSLTPNSPLLPDIVTSKFAVCGQVVVDKLPQAISGQDYVRTILLVGAGKSGHEAARVQTTSVTPNNRNQQKFCALVAPGSYFVRPLVSANEEQVLGLRLAPVEHRVEVKDQSVQGLKFSQFRALVKGSVRCLETCPTGQLEVTLSPQGREVDLGGQPVTQHIKVDKSNSGVGEFQFSEVMPGEYLLELHTVGMGSNSWCWKALALPVTVTDHDPKPLVLEHSGYAVPVVTSHPVKLQYRLKPKVVVKETPAGKKATPKVVEESIVKGEWSLERGSAQVCLPKPGDYVLTAISCQHLEQTEMTYSTSSVAPVGGAGPIQVIAAEHGLRVRFQAESVEAVSKIKDLEVLVSVDGDSESDFKKLYANPLPVKLNPKTLQGEVEIWIRPGEGIRLTARSSLTLIQPNSVLVSTTGEECSPLVYTFNVVLGLFVTGQITPAISQVNVTVTMDPTSSDSLDEDSDIVAQLVTDEKGRFSVGPLARDRRYGVSVSKAGYTFMSKQEPDQEKAVLHLEWSYGARKLAEVLVLATEEDAEGVKVLPGVLLAVVGDDYRANQLTDEEGKYSFVGLAPGTYYFRAVMKEYVFTPPGAQSIQVDEGKSVQLRVVGKRSAYSAIGLVTSLTGDPESGIVVEARELGPSKGATKEEAKRCITAGSKIRAEQATTDDNGAFRIRGLWPGCHYEILVKLDSPGINQLIERTVPNLLTIDMKTGDVSGIKVYAFRRINMMEISAAVRTPNEAHLSSLRLTVFPANQPDHILARHNFATDALLFSLSSILPTAPTATSPTSSSRSYVLRLESTLSPDLYSNISAQELTFTSGNGSNIHHQHFVFHFRPTAKSVPDQDQSPTILSLVTLPLLLALCIVVYLHRERCGPVADQTRRILADMFVSATTGKPTVAVSSSATSSKSDPGIDLSSLSDLNNFVAKANSGQSQSTAPVKRSTPWGRSSRKT